MTACQPLAKPIGEQTGFPIQADHLLNHPLRRACGARGKELDNARLVNGRQVGKGGVCRRSGGDKPQSP